MSERYAIRSAAEARAYLADPLLGSPDGMKLRSSETLFAAVSASQSVFHRILETYYGGVEDAVTLRLLARSPCPPLT